MKIGQRIKNSTLTNSGSSMKYDIIFSKQANKDKKSLKSAGLEHKAKAILVAMQNDPFCYPPPYEKLVGQLSGLYSRRINQQHRIIYEVVGAEIHIICMWTHYENV